MMSLLISIVIVQSILLAGLGVLLFLRWKGVGKVEREIDVHRIVERVRAVGKLVGFEVLHKEIVTEIEKLKWMPKMLVTPARVAMIFYFEKQYYIDLLKLSEADIEEIAPGRYMLTIPPLAGDFCVRQMEAYDIQSRKVVGLFDATGIDEQRFNHLMERAREEAENLYEKQADRYEVQARESIARLIKGLFDRFDIDVRIRFADQSEPINLSSRRTFRIGAGGIGAASSSARSRKVISEHTSTASESTTEDLVTTG